jgi:hypothetical protein
VALQVFHFAKCYAFYSILFCLCFEINFTQCKSLLSLRLQNRNLVALSGIEPEFRASETLVLSIEL